MCRNCVSADIMCEPFYRQKVSGHVTNKRPRINVAARLHPGSKAHLIATCYLHDFQNDGCYPSISYLYFMYPMKTVSKDLWSPPPVHMRQCFILVGKRRKHGSELGCIWLLRSCWTFGHLCLRLVVQKGSQPALEKCIILAEYSIDGPHKLYPAL